MSVANSTYAPRGYTLCTLHVETQRGGALFPRYQVTALFLNTSKNRTRTRTNTNPNGTEANAAGRSGNARALHKQSKCEMIQEGEALAKFLGKFAKIEVFVGFAHSAEQQRGRRASREARDLRNTRSTRKRSKCAFQRARRLLFCP